MGVVVPFRPKRADQPTGSWDGSQYACYDSAFFASLSDEQVQLLIEAGEAGLAASERKMREFLDRPLFT